MPSECCKETWFKIPDDEPVFIIRGKDLFALDIITLWVMLATAADVNVDKLRRAEQHLEAVEAFQAKYPERCKIPD